MTRRRLTRAERKEDTRARLLASAARVFARRGFHAASVEEVAEVLGLPSGPRSQSRIVTFDTGYHRSARFPSMASST